MANKHLKLLMSINRLNSLANRRFGVQGLSLSEFMILSALEATPEEKLRPVDLAEKMGLTASGITRMLLPMEKIGLIKRVADKTDARVSYAAIAPSGKRILSEAQERADLVGEEIVSSNKHIVEDIKKLL